MIRILMLAIFVVAPSSEVIRANAMPIEHLRKRCSVKTVVMKTAEGGEIVRAGEKFDGYCSGFLEGVLLSLEKESVICPDREAENIDTNYLFSLVDTYTRETNIGGMPAIEVIKPAYKRAFPCKTK